MDQAPHAERPSETRSRRFRVDHVADGRSTVVGFLDRPLTHHTGLVPYAARLQQLGVIEGELVAVDGATERVLARRNLAHPIRPPRWKPTPQPRRRPTRSQGLTACARG